MLTQFTMRWTFAPVKVRAWIDCETREAAIAVQELATGRLLAEYDLPASDAARMLTPEAADRWMREGAGPVGNRLEVLAWNHRHGIYDRDRARQAAA